MHYLVWILAGMGLVWLAGLIEALGDLGGTPEARLPFYFAALGTLGGALYCFFKAFRGFSADLPFSKRSKQDESAEPEAKVRPARKIVDAPEKQPSDFDVDAAFSRYMNKRDSNPAAHSANANNAPAAPTRSGFGRKGL
ncbi:MAG: hypothetical protein AAFZ11_12025 [Pseudomonadota bacterium]